MRESISVKHFCSYGRFEVIRSIGCLLPNHKIYFILKEWVTGVEMSKKKNEAPKSSVRKADPPSDPKPEPPKKKAPG